jgi:nuclear migration protein JNM1
MSPLSPTLHSAPALHHRESNMHRREGGLSGSQAGARHSKSDKQVDPGITKLDSPVGELERVVGSSAALDESSPPPSPLLLILTRLNTQLTILTQPADDRFYLEAAEAAVDRFGSNHSCKSGETGGWHGLGWGSGGQGKAVNAGGGTGGGAGGASTIQEQLATILRRLAPHLPALPHILARLRTLSSLHAAASDFQRGMEQVCLCDK